MLIEIMAKSGIVQNFSFYIWEAIAAIIAKLSINHFLPRPFQTVGMVLPRLSMCLREVFKNAIFVCIIF